MRSSCSSRLQQSKLDNRTQQCPAAQVGPLQNVSIRSSNAEP